MIFCSEGKCPIDEKNILCCFYCKNKADCVKACTSKNMVCNKKRVAEATEN
ncbi:hypothetical protein [Clostridium manihotivorum]|uniref:hypothetical protein n=1 Tax=Clostridium manihotivorum TaxID=2320868 RepID=UPI0013E32043|nr:hypothetical protein [Clostridium manihotivorum]